MVRMSAGGPPFTAAASAPVTSSINASNTPPGDEMISSRSVSGPTLVILCGARAQHHFASAELELGVAKLALIVLLANDMGLVIGVPPGGSIASHKV